jgi:hypothetical protein
MHIQGQGHNLTLFDKKKKGKKKKKELNHKPEKLR